MSDVCTSCMMESFYDGPGVDVLAGANNGGYSCQEQGQPPCIYTTQGEIICNMPSNPPKNVNVAGGAFVERFPRVQQSQ